MASLPETWLDALRTADDPLAEARELLEAWLRFARDLEEAGVIAHPVRLYGRTVGYLDATAV